MYIHVYVRIYTYYVKLSCDDIYPLLKEFSWNSQSFIFIRLLFIYWPTDWFYLGEIFW